MVGACIQTGIKRMKITLHRSGGFAGSVGATSFELDPLALPEPRRAQLLALLDAANVAGQPAIQRLASPHPWDFLYSLQIEDGPFVHRLQLQLAAVSVALRDLVLLLEEESLRPTAARD